jgi:hypothetical protein
MENEITQVRQQLETARADLSTKNQEIQALQDERIIPTDNLQTITDNLTNIVMIGETGVGKSTIGQALLGRTDVFEIGSGINSCSQETLFGEGFFLGQVNDQEIRVIDTQGYNDPNGQDYEHAQDMIVKIRSLQMVKAFLIVMNGSNVRWNQATWNVLNLFNNMFNNFWSNVVFVINFWPEDPRSVGVRTRSGRTEGSLTENITTELQRRFGNIPIRIEFLDAMYFSPDEELLFKNHLRNIQLMWSLFENYPTDDIQVVRPDSENYELRLNALVNERNAIRDRITMLEVRIQDLQNPCWRGHNYQQYMEQREIRFHSGGWGGFLHGHHCCGRCSGNFSCNDCLRPCQIRTEYNYDYRCTRCACRRP